VSTDTEQWRFHQLPDGRVAECVDVQWARVSGDEAPGTIGIDVTILIDGHLETHRIDWTSERLERAFREVGDRS
jgi:hypothetical protein